MTVSVASPRPSSATLPEDPGPVRVTRLVEAPPEVVFTYLTSSEKWSLWQGVDTTIEAWPGGAYVMRAPNGGVARGEVLEIVPDRSVTFTWGWEGHPHVPPGATTVTIALEPTGSGTLITLTHLGLPADERGLHRQGWDHYADRLALAAAGKVVPPDPGLGVG